MDVYPRYTGVGRGALVGVGGGGSGVVGMGVGVSHHDVVIVGVDGGWVSWGVGRWGSQGGWGWARRGGGGAAHHDVVVLGVGRCGVRLHHLAQ